MRIIATYIIFLLVSYGMQGQDVDRLISEKDDKKAMYQVLAQLEDKNDTAINTFINAFIQECTLQEREYLKNQVVMRLYGIVNK